MGDPAARCTVAKGDRSPVCTAPFQTRMPHVSQRSKRKGWGSWIGFRKTKATVGEIGGRGGAGVWEPRLEVGFYAISRQNWDSETSP